MKNQRKSTNSNFNYHTLKNKLETNDLSEKEDIFTSPTRPNSDMKLDQLASKFLPKDLIESLEDKTYTLISESKEEITHKKRESNTNIDISSSFSDDDRSPFDSSDLCNVH